MILSNNKKHGSHAKEMNTLTINSKKSYLPQIIIVLFSFLLYSNTLNHKYALDDTLVITQNNFTKQGLSGIKSILSTDSFVGFFGENRNLLPGGRYRPLSHITFAVEYEFFGLEPKISHLINVLLYSLLCLLIYLVLKKLLLKYDNLNLGLITLPFITTLLWACHPLHTEVVANIKGRDEIMSLLGIFGSLFYTLKYVEKKQYYWLILSFITFFLGLMSKENAITFVVIIPLCIYFFNDIKLKNILLVFLPLIAAFVLFMFIRYLALGFIFDNKVAEIELLNDPYIYSTVFEKYATILYTMGKYLLLLIFPHPLTHDYYPNHIPIINWSDLRAVVSLLAYILFLFVSIKGFFKKNIWSFGILFFLISFSIASNLVLNVGTFMNERFMFAPSLGFCLIFSYCILLYMSDYNQSNLKFKKNLILSLLVVFVLGFSIKTYSRNLVWENDFTLFTTDVNVSDKSAKCTVSAGGSLIDKAKEETNPTIKKNLLIKAANYLNTGVSEHPKYDAGWLLYGTANLYLEKYEEAIICYENCLKLSNSYSYALNNLQYLAQQTNKDKLQNYSIKAYKTLLKYYPKNAEYIYELAVVYDNINLPDTAMKLLNTAVLLKPDFYQAYNKMGELWGKRYNNIQKSLDYLNKAKSINPKDFSTLENLGVAYGISKMYKESVLAFEDAIKIKPDNPQIYRNLGNTYYNMGLTAKAKQMYATSDSIKQLQK